MVERLRYYMKYSKNSQKSNDFCDIFAHFSKDFCGTLTHFSKDFYFPKYFLYLHFTSKSFLQEGHVQTCLPFFFGNLISALQLGHFL